MNTFELCFSVNHRLLCSANDQDIKSLRQAPSPGVVLVGSPPSWAKIPLGIELLFALEGAWRLQREVAGVRMVTSRTGPFASNGLHV